MVQNILLMHQKFEEVEVVVQIVVVQIGVVQLDIDLRV